MYPQEESFDSCYYCSSKEVFENSDLGSIEIVFTINYTRSSLLLGGIQSTLATTCVSLLEEEGMKVIYYKFFPEVMRDFLILSLLYVHC